MAGFLNIGKIRTGLGPEATADRRKFLAAKDRRAKELKLEQEASKQAQSASDAAQAIFALSQDVEEVEAPTGLQDPNVQAGLAVASVAAFIAWRRGAFG